MKNTDNNAKVNKILTPEKTFRIAEVLHTQKKKIVVAGGCFDILHDGHRMFLKKAKEKGDALMVLLESNEKITKLKGPKRPLNSQYDRAAALSWDQSVDYIVLLPNMKTNDEYDEMISHIKPAIIATTKGDPGRFHKERQAKLYGSKVLDVIERIDDLSTTKFASKLQK